MKVSEISAELDRIWDSLEGTNKMRASLFNLLVVTPKNNRTAYVLEITHKVLHRFPSRVIFITLDKTHQDDYLDASVSLIPGARGEYDVVCDFISLDSSRKSLPKIPFVILPHLLPDLPVYLLWCEDPVQDNPLSHQLERWTTRIIFDSEVTDNLPAFAQTLLDHRRETGCEIADLNWARIENWRELFSATFYSPDRLQMLKEAQKIRIVYNAHETESFCHTKIQALYLQSWLASELGWKLTKAQPSRFEYGPLTIELEPEKNPDLSPGTIISIDIFTSKEIHYEFCRDKTYSHHIRVIICDANKCEIPTKFIFSKAQSGLSLINEVTHVGTSPHFLKVLEFLTPLDRQCLS